MAGLGVSCILLFSLCAWFAWPSPPARGGPRAALVFVVFVLLGVVLVVTAQPDTSGKQSIFLKTPTALIDHPHRHIARLFGGCERKWIGAHTFSP